MNVMNRLERRLQGTATYPSGRKVTRRIDKRISPDGANYDGIFFPGRSADDSVIRDGIAIFRFTNHIMITDRSMRENMVQNVIQSMIYTNK